MSRMRLRTMPQRTMSMTQATSVARNASREVRAMRMVPDRWYAAPQSPKSTERPESPAAMGWRIPSFLVWLIKGRDYWLWTTGDLWSGKQCAKES